MTTTKTPVILSYGMGVDSTAILLRWLEEPESRDFDLSDLVVLTAMTGMEFSSTACQVREHILPRLRQHGVRFVQVARADKAGRLAVLDDSDCPAELHFEGEYTILDEFMAAGTVPYTAQTRLCSIKSKGQVLDAWVDSELKGRSYRHAIGFAVGEEKRVARDQSFGTCEGRLAEYPLINWGWDREECLSYIKQHTGEDWLKSACTFCPYSRGCDEVMARYQSEPEAAAEAAEVEAVAMAMNPTAKLFLKTSLREALEADGNTKALKVLDARLAEKTWELYEVRRFRKDSGYCVRSIRKLGVTGSQADVMAELASVAETTGVEADGQRLVLLDTDTETSWVKKGIGGRVEQTVVAAPTGVTEKSGRISAETFTKFWTAVAQSVGVSEVETGHEAPAAPQMNLGL